MVSSYCHCTSDIAVVCTRTSPLNKVCCILHLCPTHPLLRAGDGTSIHFSTVKDSVMGGKVDSWLGCHSYLITIAGFANHLGSYRVPIPHWSIYKLTIYIYFGVLSFMYLQLWSNTFFHLLAATDGTASSVLFTSLNFFATKLAAFGITAAKHCFAMEQTTVKKEVFTPKEIDSYNKLVFLHGQTCCCLTLCILR